MAEELKIEKTFVTNPVIINQCNPSENQGGNKCKINIDTPSKDPEALHAGKGEYIELIMKCPAIGNHGVDRSAAEWNGCSKIQINQYGHVRCGNNHGDAFVNWRWACAKHRNDYRQADAQYLLMSLQSILANSSFPNINTMKWFQKLVMNIQDQFGIEESSDDDD
eukprot:410982_1